MPAYLIRVQIRDDVQDEHGQQQRGRKDLVVRQWVSEGSLQTLLLEDLVQYRRLQRGTMHAHETPTHARVARFPLPHSPVSALCTASDAAWLLTPQALSTTMLQQSVHMRTRAGEHTHAHTLYLSDEQQGHDDLKGHGRLVTRREQRERERGDGRFNVASHGEGRCHADGGEGV